MDKESQGEQLEKMAKSDEICSVVADRLSVRLKKYVKKYWQVAVVLAMLTSMVPGRDNQKTSAANNAPDSVGTTIPEKSLANAEPQTPVGNEIISPAISPANTEPQLSANADVTPKETAEESAKTPADFQDERAELQDDSGISSVPEALRGIASKILEAERDRLQDNTLGLGTVRQSGNYISAIIGRQETDEAEIVVFKITSGKPDDRIEINDDWIINRSTAYKQKPSDMTNKEWEELFGDDFPKGDGNEL